LAVKVILALNSLVPSTQIHQNLAEAKGTVADYQDWELDEIQRIYGEFGPHSGLRDKLVLDVGCGLGGKLRFYAKEGAARVVGVDLRFQSALAAAQLAESDSSITSTAVADGARLPFADNSFDLVVSVNVLEHVADPEAMLDECRRVLRYRGRLLLHFPPFYSPWGPHLDGWVNFPWPHLFFSERDLVQAAAQVEAQKHLNDRFIPAAQVQWDGLEKLPELNRLTIRQFQSLVAAKWPQGTQLLLLPFGRHALLKNSLGRLLLRVLYALARLPLLNEIIVTKIACTMIKEDLV